MKDIIKLFKKSALAALLVLTLTLVAGCSAGSGADLLLASSPVNETAGGNQQADLTGSDESPIGEPGGSVNDMPQPENTGDLAEGEAPEDGTGALAETFDTGIPASETRAPQTEAALTVDRDGHYDSAEDVSLYLHLYGELPSNYITKKEAQKLGWEGGSLEPYAPGCSIGGSFFGNYEGILPSEDEYHECDIDTIGKKSRGAKRIVYSDDGDIYYTEDHYESFLLLYTAEGLAEEEIRFQ